MLLLGQGQALGAAAGSVQLDLGGRQQLSHHHQIHVVVVHHQNVGLRGLEALVILLPLVGLDPGCQGKLSQSLVIYNVLLQHYHKGRTSGVDAVDADFAPHQLYQLVDDAQPQAGALNVAVLFLIHPLKGVEDIGDVLLFHPLAAVLHRVPNPHPVHSPALTPDGELHKALPRIFNCIVQQVYQDLLDAHLVAKQHTGDGGVHMEPEFQPLLLGLYPNHIDDFGKKLPRLVRDIYNLHLAGLYLGKVQDVVDQGEEHLAGALDVPGVFSYLL